MLLDTSGLLCLLHKAESFHKEAVAAYQSTHTRLIHNYILAEFVALAQVRGLPRTTALAFVSDLLEHPSIEMVWVTEPLHREAIALLLDRPDKTYSLCDAVSFVLMRQRNITDALTTDRHFEQEGFRRVLTPA